LQNRLPHGILLDAANLYWVMSHPIKPLTKLGEEDIDLESGKQATALDVIGQFWMKSIRLSLSATNIRE
jgi:hypothetical protein